MPTPHPTPASPGDVGPDPEGPIRLPPPAAGQHDSSAAIDDLIAELEDSKTPAWADLFDRAISALGYQRQEVVALQRLRAAAGQSAPEPVCWGTVIDVGGGQVDVLVDRDTEQYPDPGYRVAIYRVERSDG